MTTILIIAAGYVGSAIALKLFHSPQAACVVLGAAVLSAWFTRQK